jgi:iron complex outermembrane receptor protein
MKINNLKLKQIALVISLCFDSDVIAQEKSQIKELGVVTVKGDRPSSLPTNIPTTMESISGREIEEKINATDSEDALKYFPSLLVRKRYIGDYNHAMLSSRASGTGNPARSAVYADGILLSNYLGNSISGLSFPPRWGMVTPEEIERVDVMYGPFSAAYPGNSVGAVVDYVTRMPTQFESHAKIGYSHQPFSLYNTNANYRAWQTSASVGDKNGDWSYFLNFNHTDSVGQPLTFATRTVSTGVAPTTGIAVNGAVADKNNANAGIYVIGAGTQYSTVQDHIKTKLAYDFNSTMRATYTLGIWQNTSEGRPTSYLTSAATGASVTSGPIVINGKQFSNLTGADFPLTNESITHFMHGLSLKTNTQEKFDWEVAFSLYDYSKDQKRQNGTNTILPNALSTGAGTIADGAGTGWNNLALRGTWRPYGVKGEHIVDFGYQQDNYKLQYLTSNITGNWITDAAGSMSSNVGGKTQMHSLYAQDTWRFSPRWKTVLGLRSETWSAFDGYTQIASNSTNISYADRKETFFSPKAALSFQLSETEVLKSSTGRAVRMPTVFELYGATSTTNSRFINDPNLNPERSWTTEFSYEKDLNNALLRLTYFYENTQDGLFSQSIFDPVANTTVTRVQNVGRIETHGLETAYSGQDILFKGLDLAGSITYTDSIIKENLGFVLVAGDTIGKMQPNIPHWRATAVSAYRFNSAWTGSLAARYSGNQFRTLNNSDVNGFTYQGVSRFFTVDARARYKIDKEWSMAFGIDNLNNYQYWNFHPYPQRTYYAELKYDFK